MVQQIVKSSLGTTIVPRTVLPCVGDGRAVWAGGAAWCLELPQAVTAGPQLFTSLRGGELGALPS